MVYYFYFSCKYFNKKLSCLLSHLYNTIVSNFTEINYVKCLHAICSIGCLVKHAAVTTEQCLFIGR